MSLQLHKFDCGTKVCEIDGRHVGTVIAVLNTVAVRVRWDDNGFISDCYFRHLREVCDRCEIILNPEGSHQCGDCGRRC